MTRPARLQNILEHKTGTFTSIHTKYYLCRSNKRAKQVTRRHYADVAIKN